MAKPGDVIENPAIGDRIVFLKTARETNGELLEFEILVQPSAIGPPVHIHPGSEERFQVLQGSLQARVDDREMSFSEGDEFIVPANTPHTWWNAGAVEALVLVGFRPASRMETFLETFYGLAKDGKTNAKGIPNLLQLAVSASAYFDVNHLATPPLAVQKVMFGILRPFARLLGYKADYSYPYKQDR